MQGWLPLTIGCALLSHLIFNRIDPRKPLVIVNLLALPPAVITSILWYDSSAGGAVPLWVFFKISAVYFGTLLASIVLYRLSPFHPLAAYPGPFICKITRLWALYNALTGKQHEYQKALHTRYGPFVRTGPNHMHISDAAALPIVMAAQPFKRGERYEISKIPGSSGALITLMDPDEHAQRRKIWERGLNTSAIQDYGALLSIRVQQLTEAIESRQSEAVNLSDWLSWLSFDFMGDLAFGKSFDLLKNGHDNERYTEQTHLATRYREIMSTFPWLDGFLEIFGHGPGLTKLRKFALESTVARIKRGNTRKDLFHYLLDDKYGLGNTPSSFPNLINEAALVIIAGSDTTGTALGNFFYFLLAYPDVYARLQAEVDREFPRGADIFADTSITSRDMSYLNAVINETLRLRPAVPNGIQRKLHKGSVGGGILIADHWIPEGTTIQIPAYAIHQNSQYFSPHPEKFIPERWLEESGPDYILDQSAYFPFSFGPTNCVGKYLALFEMRMVVCSLLQKFEFSFAPDYDPTQWERDLTDCFILAKGNLPVNVKIR